MPPKPIRRLPPDRILALIQRRAKERGITPQMLTKQTGIAYSRSWHLLHAKRMPVLRNIWAALELLAPEVVDSVNAALVTPADGKP